MRQCRFASLVTTITHWFSVFEAFVPLCSLKKLPQRRRTVIYQHFLVGLATVKNIASKYPRVGTIVFTHLPFACFLSSFVLVVPVNASVSIVPVTVAGCDSALGVFPKQQQRQQLHHHPLQ